MKLSFSFLLVVITSHFIRGQEPIDSRQREIVFHLLNVIPMDKEQAIENQDVVVMKHYLPVKGTAWRTLRFYLIEYLI